MKIKCTCGCHAATERGVFVEHMVACCQDGFRYVPFEEQDLLKAKNVYMQITSYNPLKWLGPVNREWIVEKIAEAIFEARTKNSQSCAPTQ